MRRIDLTAEIFCIGTEVLIGDIVNTNAAYIARRLSESGINVYYHSVCGDNNGRMKECLDLALSRSDLVITTGGLGLPMMTSQRKWLPKSSGFRLY